MRFLLTFFFAFASLAAAHSQFVCFSDSTTIYEFADPKLPPMVGEARFHSGSFTVIVGGKFLDERAPELEAVYNCDMLILDDQTRKMYVLPLSYFPPFVADQFSGVHYCYTSDRDTAYLMGGFGYDLSKGYETTFPMMTIFPINTLIDSVIHHRDYQDLFEVVDDSRLAITEGNLVRIGSYFLVYNGREIKALEEEFTDRVTVSEWDFRGQLRKFTLKNKDGYRQVAEYQICNTSKVFYQCMPDSWKPDPRKIEIDPKDDR